MRTFKVISGRLLIGARRYSLGVEWFLGGGDFCVEFWSLVFFLAFARVSAFSGG